jgi:hypothetical protein
VPVAKQERRNEELVRRHVAGEPYTELARRYGVSPQRVALICRREATAAVNRLELQLLLDLKRETTTTFVVPCEPREDRDLALAWLAYVLRRLAERDVEVAVDVRDAPNGTAYALHDVTHYGRQS